MSRRYEMRIPFFLVWRQLRRGSIWTVLLIVFLMAVAFINLIFVNSLFRGIIEGTNKQIVNTATGHVVIVPTTASGYFADPSAALATLSKEPDVTAVSARTEFPARLSFKDRHGSWSVVAVNPNHDGAVTTIPRTMIAGTYLASDDRDGIILGRQIAGGKDVEMDALALQGIAVGDTVEVDLLGQATSLVVRGIFATKFIDTDQTAFVSFATLQEHFPLYQDKITNILVRLKSTGREEAFVQRLTTLGLEGSYYTWQDAAGLMTSVTKSFLSIDVVLSFVAILIAAVTIFIVVYIDISSKKREIGILRAIGIKPYLIRSAYILQTVFYSLAGIAVGSILFFGGILPYFVAHPFRLPIVDASLSFSAADLTIRIESIIIVSILAGLLPAYRFTRIKILDAIWGAK